MAAPMSLFSRGGLLKKICMDHSFSACLFQNFNKQSRRTFPFKCLSSAAGGSPLKTKWRQVVFTTGAVSVLVGTGVAASVISNKLSVYADSNTLTKPSFKVTRHIENDIDSSGLKLTLFQHQTCPFCCKTRAFLDYYGFSYDVVEVSLLFRTEIKWSKYRKVPILICDGGREDEFLQINDSSLIISLLESRLIDPHIPLDRLLEYYPCIETQKGKKTVYEFQNKYFVMFPEKEAYKTTSPERSKERKWRMWTDDELVHVLAPNMYRTPTEALQSLRNFSKVGDWKNVFSASELFTVEYIGTFAMYILGQFLKKKYNLKDVRQSLYSVCKEWTEAVGEDKFLGGEKPNLADLSVYGNLHALEGCAAFEDLLNNTDIGSWYFRMKKAVTSHAGATMNITK